MGITDLVGLLHTISCLVRTMKYASLFVAIAAMFPLADAVATLDGVLVFDGSASGSYPTKTLNLSAGQGLNFRCPVADLQHCFPAAPTQNVCPGSAVCASNTPSDQDSVKKWKTVFPGLNEADWTTRIDSKTCSGSNNTGNCLLQIPAGELNTTKTVTNILCAEDANKTVTTTVLLIMNWAAKPGSGTSSTSSSEGLGALAALSLTIATTLLTLR